MIKDKRIRELLHEYVRGELDDKLAGEMASRINASDSLKQELAQVKAYYAALETVEPVQASDTFLDNVHARIKSESGIRGLIRRLFLPLHIKIPLELAGVAATLFIIVFLYTPYIGQKLTKDSALSMESGSVSGEPAPSARETEELPKSYSKQKKADATLPAERAVRSGMPAGANPAPRKEAPPSLALSPQKSELSKSTISASDLLDQVSVHAGSSGMGAPAAAASAPLSAMNLTGGGEQKEKSVEPRPGIVVAWNYSTTKKSRAIDPENTGARRQFEKQAERMHSAAEPPNAPENDLSAEGEEELLHPEYAFLRSQLIRYDASFTTADSAAAKTFSITILSSNLTPFLNSLKGRGTLTVTGDTSAGTADRITILLKITRN